jgi:hypothetical protein
MGALTAIAEAQEPMKNIRWYFDQIEQLQDEGKLAEADRMARQTIEDYRASAPAEQLQAMEFELERSRRIRQDYSLPEIELPNSNSSCSSISGKSKTAIASPPSPPSCPRTFECT